MKDPIRICFVVEDLLPAGTELWIIKMIQYLDRSRVEPYVCLLHGGDERSPLRPNCQVLRLGMKKMRSLHGLRSARRFWKFIKQNEIDIVQVHHADATYFALPVAKLAGVKKTIQTKYDVGYWLGATDLWLHRLFRRLVDVTIANCNACKQASIRQEWSPADSVVVVENGISMEKLTAIPDLAFEKSRVVNVGMVCNLRDIKNPLAFVHAADRITRSFPHTHFHLAGDGPLQDAVQGLVREKGLQHKLRQYGRISDIPGFLAKNQIAVLCSRSEGLSHALLEYMAAGRAIVATDVGGNSELIHHENNGLLVPSDDIDALADAITKLIQDPRLAANLGHSARQSVTERFSCESMARRFEDFYVDLIHNSKRMPLIAAARN